MDAFKLASRSFRLGCNPEGFPKNSLEVKQGQFLAKFLNAAGFAGGMLLYSNVSGGTYNG